MNITRNEILEDLDRFNEYVFAREMLTDKQAKALVEEGFSQINEYCVNEKRVISVLVRQEKNFTPTHTFLAWSAHRLIEDLSGTKYVDRHTTKGPDITFKFNGKDFAVEIETGCLLRKKEQLEDKIKGLNRKYGKRWMILVSHRKLLSKYRKFGFVTQRSDFEKNIKKLLNSYT